MKHLRKFNESLEDKGYEQISEDQFKSGLGVGTDSFTDHERDKIKEIAPNILNTIKGGNKSLQYLYNTNSSVSLYHKQRHIINKYNYDYKITKTDDEWFYLTTDLNGVPKYYKCDQISGVIDLVNFLSEKYLRKWGWINESNGSDDMYHHIYPEQLPWKNDRAIFLEYTQYEKDILDELGLDIEYDDTIMRCKVYRGPTIISVYKTDDEWFYVYFKENWYKCDQLNGLIQLLKDKVISNISESISNESKSDYNYDLIIRIMMKEHGWGNGCLAYIEQFEKDENYFSSPVDNNDYANQFQIYLTDIKMNRMRGTFGYSNSPSTSVRIAPALYQ